jgi:hypothetical protein
MTNRGEVFNDYTTDAAKEETQASRVQRLLANQVEEIVQLKARVKVLEHELYWNTRALDGSQIGRKHDADRIEALEAALREIACDGEDCDCQAPQYCSYGIARLALGEKKDG